MCAVRGVGEQMDAVSTHVRHCCQFLVAMVAIRQMTCCISWAGLVTFTKCSSHIITCILGCAFCLACAFLPVLVVLLTELSVLPF